MGNAGESQLCCLKSANRESWPSLMMMATVIMIMATVRAALGLKRCLQPSKIRSKAEEHVLDYMIRANSKHVVADFGRQMTVSQVPRQAHKLIRIFVPHLDNRLGPGLNLEPPSIFQLQTISICHRDRFWKIEKDVFALI